MKKQINEVTKNKKHFDPNRHCYMDKDGNYVYQIMQYNEAGKLVPAKVIIERDADNTDLIELLNQMDIEEFDCYEREKRHLTCYELDSDEGNDEESIPDEATCVQPIEAIPDDKYDPFNILFGNEDTKDKNKEWLIKRVQQFLETLNKDQQKLYYRHIVEGKTFGEICKEDGEKVTVKAYQRRWVKIRNRASKFFNMELSSRWD